LHPSLHLKLAPAMPVIDAAIIAIAGNLVGIDDPVLAVSYL
jgi:hypothetical protein